MYCVYFILVRTPTGSFLGGLKSESAVKLGSVAIRGALEKIKVGGEKVDEVFMGSVLQGGLKQAPVTQAMLGAGIPYTTPSTTVNKVCASGMKSVMFGAQAIQLKQANVIVAGGMESMSNAPYLVPRGLTYGMQQLSDMIIHDGLLDPYDNISMGLCTEEVAEKHNITREMQDAYSVASYERAQEAHKNGLFAEEIVPVEIQSRKGKTVVESDEEIFKVKFDKVSEVKPVFKKDGTITVISASKISDGASAMVLMGEDAVQKSGIKPLAEIISYADAATKPKHFATAPLLAIPIALKRANLALKDIAKWELNEAFSVVPLLATKVFGIDHSIINTRGSGISLGHPLGSSGSRILVTLTHMLKQNEYGCAAICNGGGGASAVIIKKL
ncbi:Acetyl-CoA acetyltransferase [Zancudomyces culisetae]|uniref:Acetyl-CoA acetyltransferase n=1 Tax=Zancudomyces culisetae TaxID=1213189 RepID=A0A1R1PFL4_ZANCU|nr:Acetyl-CoA acetyltransferase [Zancudomyces culisetae]|eukprot:OMH79761.1 Acetyl-CoA acetyltransferase [Zancudomyces culisetae]